MSAVTDTRWLMHYQTLNLVNQCRRLIRAEFDQKLALADPQLQEKLAYFAGRSQSQGLQRLYGEVCLAQIKHEQAEAAPSASKAEPAPRRYRGQVMDAKQPAEREKRSDSGNNEDKQASLKMYRGQPILG